MDDTRPEPTPVRSVDLTGEVCPMTFVKAKLHIERLAAGETVEIVLRGDEQLRSVAMSIKAEGHRIESVRQEGEHHRVVVRRGE